MDEGEDFLFRVVDAGYIRAESLIDGSVDLEFIALCNEALDVKQENLLRIRAAEEARRKLQG